MAIDWGAAPDWVTAGVALLALAVAAVAAWAAVNTNRSQMRVLVLQQKQLDDLASEREKEQASKVAAWIVFRPFDLEEGEFWTTETVRGQYAYHIRNDSSLPLYDVHLIIASEQVKREPESDHELRLRRKMGRAKGVYHMFHSVVAPGAKSEGAFIDESGLKDYRLTMTFRDSAGRHWSRDGDGVLSPASGDM